MSDDALAEHLAKRDLGTVIVWDTGPYQNITERDGKLVPMAEALADGRSRSGCSGALPGRSAQPSPMMSATSVMSRPRGSCFNAVSTAAAEPMTSERRSPSTDRSMVTT